MKIRNKALRYTSIWLYSMLALASVGVLGAYLGFTMYQHGVVDQPTVAELLNNQEYYAKASVLRLGGGAAVFVSIIATPLFMLGYTGYLVWNILTKDTFKQGKDTFSYSKTSVKQ